MKNLNSILFALFMVNVLVAGDDLAITVTNSNLALVREARNIELEKGTQGFNLVDIPTKIDPSSVLIESESNSFSVLEQNYEYDLVDVAKVLNKSINQNIQITHPELGEFTGRLISFSEDYLMLQNPGKELQIIPRSDHLKIILTDYGSGITPFITRPTLVWQVVAKKSGVHKTNISYLTNGLNWQADYVGRLSENEKELTLVSWVTVNNTSGKSYTDARLKLMAGDLNLVKKGRDRAYREDRMVQAQSTGSFSEKYFFEYHLYSLKHKTTLANNQIKQIQLFPETSIKVLKKYTVNSKKGNAVDVTVSFPNTKTNQLGFALPGGKVRLYKEDEKDLEFIGEDLIKHTPKDEELVITVGKAFDVISERNVLKTERPTKRSRRQVVEYVVRNHKDKNVEIVIEEQLNIYQQNKLITSSQPPVEKQAKYYRFHLPLKANDEGTLKIEYITSW